jgi:hypothetical protein
MMHHALIVLLSNATGLTEQLQREAFEKHVTTQRENIIGDSN